MISAFFSLHDFQQKTHTWVYNASIGNRDTILPCLAPAQSGSHQGEVNFFVAPCTTAFRHGAHAGDRELHFDHKLSVVNYLLRIVFPTSELRSWNC